VLHIFITLKNSIALTRFEPASIGSSSKHTNHYATGATQNIPCPEMCLPGLGKSEI
jgi:hypothetical protein